MALKQEIRKNYKTPFEKAKVYYAMLFSINGMHLSPTELDLVAFSAVNGTLSTPPLRGEFLEKFNLSENYLNTILPKLRKQGLLVKDDNKKMRVNPKILIDFKEDIRLEIKLVTDNQPINDRTEDTN